MCPGVRRLQGCSPHLQAAALARAPCPPQTHPAFREQQQQGNCHYRHSIFVARNAMLLYAALNRAQCLDAASAPARAAAAPVW